MQGYVSSPFTPKLTNSDRGVLQIIAGTSSSLGVSQDSREAYKYLIVFCALTPIVASLLLVPVRLHFSKKLLAKV